MKKYFKRITGILAASAVMVSSVPVFAAQLPDTIIRDGRVFVMDKSSQKSEPAIPDFTNLTKRASYKVLGSDVQLYIDPSHGHGGDHFAAGWVQATAPKFTARAEVWSGSKLDTTGPNTANIGDTANACSYLAVGIVKDARARIFYNWD